ncbi:hypothetical protein COLO4_28922 [Corchorus olitorius]|uniref:CCHC-type domain-containing protein n=1 Tax=Corchorus olitorius TaxID=93759 RepID=A0A1R3HHG9_9ROSI|nr:hypothetical protein COLO4_28922 [Corchorus olitorius]
MEEITLDLEVNKDGIRSEGDWMAVGCLIAEKPVNRGAIMTILRNQWLELEALMIGEISQNLFSITFSSRKSLFDVLSENPWSVMDFGFNLKEWLYNMAVGELDFSTISYWIQIHNISRDMFSKSNVDKIASNFGTMMEVEEPIGRFGVNRTFLRARVLILADKPRCPEFWINKGADQKNWAKLKYEKLFDYCYNCGKLGHGLKSCKEAVSSETKYEANLRCEPAKKLLSPGKQRSYSWGGTQSGGRIWESKGKVARGINFGKACEMEGCRKRVQSNRPIRNFNSGIIIKEIDDLGQDIADDGAIVSSASNTSTQIEKGVAELPCKHYFQEIEVVNTEGTLCSPTKVLKFMLNLSNVFRSLSIKRGSYEGREIGEASKKQRIYELISGAGAASNSDELSKIKTVDQSSLACLNLGASGSSDSDLFPLLGGFSVLKIRAEAWEMDKSCIDTTISVFQKLGFQAALINDYSFCEEKIKENILIENTDVSHKRALPSISRLKMSVGSVFDKDDGIAAISGSLKIVMIMKFPMLSSIFIAIFCSLKFQLFRRKAIVALDWVSPHVKTGMCPSGWDPHPPFPLSWMAYLQPLKFLCVFFLVCNLLSIFEIHFFI